jgi:hypothetical protein
MFLSPTEPALRRLWNGRRLEKIQPFPVNWKAALNWLINSLWITGRRLRPVPEFQQEKSIDRDAVMRCYLRRSIAT